MKVNRFFRKSKNPAILWLQDKLLTILFHLFRVYPVCPDKIVVSCFKGHGFCDSPKYIAKKLLDWPETSNIVWLCDKDNSPEIPNGIKQVPYHSIRGIYEQATAKIWICNRRTSRYVRKRKDQYYIQTWHGGIRLKNVEQAVENKLTKRYCDGARNDSKMINIFLSNSKFSTEIIRRDMWYFGNVLQIGLPRNDLLLSENTSLIVKNVRHRFSIRPDCGIVLYAPTFRAKNNLDIYTLPSQEVLKQLKRITQKEWILLIHLHTNIPCKFLEQKSNCILDVSEYEDVQELLLASDFLITDYSSILFDFALLNKPILLFMPDLDDYLKDRAFNQPIEQLPFVKAFSPDEVSECVTKAFVQCPTNGKRWLEETYGLVENGNASEQVANIIKCVLTEGF